jgi:hypothetical protein
VSCGIGEHGQPELSRRIGPDRGSRLTALVHREKRGDSLPLLPCIFRTTAAASQANPDDHENRVEPP